MLAGGGECVTDMAALRDQPELFGDVASSATIWRAVREIDETVLGDLRVGRAAARATAWASLDVPDEVILDIARVENCSKDLRDSGLGRMPFGSFAMNQAWLELVLTGADLLAWLPGGCLDGELAKDRLPGASISRPTGVMLEWLDTTSWRPVAPS